MTSPDTSKRIVFVDQVVADFRRLVRAEIWEETSRCAWLLIGPHGAVQFVFMSFNNETAFPQTELTEVAVDVGFHSAVPIEYADTQRECDVVPGSEVCYYDGSGLEAQLWMREWHLVHFDENWMWDNLYKKYRCVFG